MKTIDIIKKKRKVPDSVKAKLKEFTKLKKQILKTLESGEKTIPEIVDESKLPYDVVTYNLMTLLKYGDIEAGELDDMDEYYYYKLKK
ncbi:MAG: hypothetical protein U9R54_03295 [Bacteroidota bacterium]|nr:hypothetical protein [Bacteroidota bacterium]